MVDFHPSPAIGDHEHPGALEAPSAALGQEFLKELLPIGVALGRAFGAGEVLRSSFAVQRKFCRNEFNALLRHADIRAATEYGIATFLVFSLTSCLQNDLTIA